MHKTVRNGRNNSKEGGKNLGGLMNAASQITVLTALHNRFSWWWVVVVLQIQTYILNSAHKHW